MATFNVPDSGGAMHTFNVDNFDQLAPGDQQAVLAKLPDMANQGAAQPAPQTPPDTSFGGAVKYGLQSAAHGLGETAKLAKLLPNGTPGRQTIADAGQGLENFAGAPDPNYKPASGAIMPDLRAGKYGAALSDVGRMGVEALPDVGAAVGAGALAAMAAPAALAGGAATAGAAAYGAARTLGDTADTRAANNGRAAPTGSDVAAALPSTAAQAALSAVGIGRLPGVGKAIEALPGLVRPLAKAGLEGAANAGSDLTGQVGSTAGTDKGLSVDPNELAAAGIGGAVARLGTMAPGVAREGLQTASDAAMQHMVPMPDDPVGNVRWNQAVQDVRQQLGSSVDDFQANNAAKAGLKNDIQAHLDAVRQAYPDTDPGDFRLARTALDAALRHNNDAGALTSQVAGLDWAPEALNPLVAGLTDLNAGKGASFRNQAAGPFQQLGRIGGTVAGPAYELAQGNLLGAAVGIAMGHKFGKVGGAIGAGVDRMLGTDTPTQMLQAAKAAAYLKANGIDSGPTASSQLGDARTTLQGLIAQQQAQQAMRGQALQSRQEADYMNRDMDLAAAQQRGQANVDNAAFNRQVPVQAQTMLDKAARLNATKLAAASMSSSDNPAVDDASAAAAVNMARQRAMGVLSQAGAIDPEASMDRITMGLPPMNPTDSPSVSPGAPAGSSGIGAGRTPQAAPQASQGAAGGGAAPALDAGIPPAVKYIQQGVIGNNLGKPDVASVHRALDAVAHPDLAAMVKSGVPVPVQNRAVLDAAVAHLVGASPGTASGPGGSSGGGQGGDGAGSGALPADPTVRRPLAYKLAADAYHAAMSEAAGAARAAGDHDQGAAIDAVRHARGRAGKLAAAAGYALPDWMLAHGPMQ